MTGRVPVLTLLLIGANLVAAFAVVANTEIVTDFGFRASVPTLSGAFVGPFLHANFFHLFGNLLFLAAVGAAVELATGTLRFGIVYVAGALAGVGFHWLIQRNHPGSLPLIGASGAIAACAAYYGARYPSFRVPILPGKSLPVVAIIATWAALQLIGAVAHLGGFGSGTAYWAHIGGLVIGAVLALAFRAPDLGQARIGHEVLDRMNQRGPAAVATAAENHLKRHPNDIKVWRELAGAYHDMGEAKGEADAILALLRLEPEAERGPLLGRLSAIGMSERIPAARRVAHAESLKETHPEVARRLLESIGERDVQRPEALLALYALERNRDTVRANDALNELTERFPLHPCTDLARQRGWIA